MKHCNRCGIQKNLTEYFNDKNTEDGKCPSCKSCIYLRRKHPTKKATQLEHKICNGCKEEKPLAAFWVDSRNKSDGRYSYCKACKTESTYAWRAKNKDRYNAKMKKYHKDTYNTGKIYRYNLSREDYNKMLSEQGGLCALCHKPNPSTKRSLAIDHCHETGKVRGILCYGCNRLMVLLDDEGLLSRAIEYKKKHA